MTDEKVFYPEEIQEQPFPFSGQNANYSSGDQSSQVEKPEEIKDTGMPPIRDVITKSLDTLSQKIMKEYQFTQNGAIRIGKYQNSVSGEILISPDGITAKNSGGVNTFSIDGDTGNATFSGQLTSASIVTGTVDVGSGSGGSYVRLDGANNRIIVHDGSYPRIVIGNI
jgi:hypothetical protein